MKTHCKELFGNKNPLKDQEEVLNIWLNLLLLLLILDNVLNKGIVFVFLHILLRLAFKKLFFISLYNLCLSFDYKKKNTKNKNSKLPISEHK